MINYLWVREGMKPGIEKAFSGNTKYALNEAGGETHSSVHSKENYQRLVPPFYKHTYFFNDNRAEHSAFSVFE